MRDSYVFYRNFYECIEKLPTKEQLAVYKAISNYALNGVETDIKGVGQIVYEMAKPNIDSNNKKYKNGCKGGRPRDDESPRKDFGEFETIILTEAQWEKIVAKRGEELAMTMVEIFDTWLLKGNQSAKQYIGKNNYGHFKEDGWLLNTAKKKLEEKYEKNNPNWSV